MCPCLALGVGQKTLRLICLIAAIQAVTSSQRQPLADLDDFVLSSPSQKAQLIEIVMCVCDLKIQSDLCLVEQIKLSPLCSYTYISILLVCVSEDCLFARNMTSPFLGQTLSFCACHIVLSVAHTPPLILHIPLQRQSALS